MTVPLGGWVRDKLLKGIDASRDADIDLAIDNMKGKDFASILEHWFKRKGTQFYINLFLFHCRQIGK